MRPQLLKVHKGNEHSFSARQDLVPYINNKWHYHSEIELIHFKKGEGTQFIGDSIKRFKSGDIVIVGSNMPHYWRFDDSYFKGNTDVRVAHFSESFWGPDFLSLPENNSLKIVLEKAKRGLQIKGKPRQAIAELLEQLISASGPKRITILIEALICISECRQLAPLSSIGFKPEFNESDNERISNIYDYSIKHFREKIPLQTIAEIANISPNSFCRYFKSRTGKPYSRFLIELRVGHACKLLIENNECIKRVCFESGFNNFASFYKYFKAITHKSPLAYQEEFIAS